MEKQETVFFPAPYGSFGTLPKDIWQVIVSHMDVATQSLMISVHPRLFGSMIQTRKCVNSRWCIPDENLRDDMKSDDVFLVDAEPLNSIFLACSHLEQDERCFGGLCNNNAHYGLLAVPSHLRMSPLVEQEHDIFNVEHDYTALLKMLVSNPAVFANLLDSVTTTVHSWHLMFSEMLTHRGVVGLCNFLEYLVRLSFLSNYKWRFFRIMEACLTQLLRFFCGGFLTKHIFPLLEAVSSDSSTDAFVKTMQSIESVIEHLPPIACYFVQRVKQLGKQPITEKIQPHSSSDAQRYPFGHVDWNCATNKLAQEPASPFDLGLAVEVVRALCAAARELFPNGLATRAEYRKFLHSLYISNANDEVHLRPILQRICDRPLMVESIHLYSRKLPKPEYKAGASSLFRRLNSEMSRLFRSYVTLLSKDELCLLSQSNLYFVTDFFHTKVIARSDAHSPYRYIRTLRAPPEEQSDVSNNSFGTAVTQVDSQLYLRSYNNRDVGFATVIRHLRCFQRVLFLDDQNRLWYVWPHNHPTRGDEDALCVRQLRIHEKVDGGVEATYEQLLGYFSSGGATIVSFRVRLTGGVVVITQSNDKLRIERYCCD